MHNIYHTLDEWKEKQEQAERRLDSDDDSSGNARLEQGRSESASNSADGDSEVEKITPTAGTAVGVVQDMKARSAETETFQIS